MKKKNVLKTVLNTCALYVCLLLSTSCAKTTTGDVSKFEGDWSGTYSQTGTVVGTWDVSINSSGKISGTTDGIGTVSGTVTSDGTWTVGSAAVASFNGHISGNNVTGTWTADGDNGTFSGSKI